MDDALLGIAEAAERGGEVPRIALFTGSMTVFGLPVSSQEAASLMRTSLAESIYAEAKPKRRERDEVSKQSSLRADAQLSSFADRLGPQSGAISLSQVVMVAMPSGETVNVPAVRIPLAAVNSWFIGAFDSDGGGGGFFGFASFPIGD